MYCLPNLNIASKLLSIFNTKISLSALLPIGFYSFMIIRILWSIIHYGNRGKKFECHVVSFTYEKILLHITKLILYLMFNLLAFYYRNIFISGFLVKNIFKLSAFRQFAEFNIKSTVWHILHSFPPIKIQIFSRASDNRLYWILVCA